MIDWVQIVPLQVDTAFLYISRVFKVSLSTLTKLTILALFDAYNMFSKIEYATVVLQSEGSPH